jgi:HSP20 family molecular chaperone IbpA
MNQIRVLLPVLTACLYASATQACPFCAFDDIFTSMRHELSAESFSSAGSTWRETPEQIILQIRLGQAIDRKDVQVTCDKNWLQVTVDKRAEKKAPAKKHGKEQNQEQPEEAASRSAYHLTSSFQLPDSADTKNPAKIKAELNAAGTGLTITVPKKELPKVTVTQEKGPKIPVAQKAGEDSSGTKASKKTARPVPAHPEPDEGVEGYERVNSAQKTPSSEK